MGRVDVRLDELGLELPQPSTPGARVAMAGDLDRVVRRRRKIVALVPWCLKADFFQELIDLHLRYGERLSSPHSTMNLYPINGASGRVGMADTASSFREAHFGELIMGVDPDPANNTRLTRWAKDYWLALHPFSSGGGYVNMMMDEGEDNVKAAYRDNYARLGQVKREYDPANLFQVNQNIEAGDR